MKYETTTVLIAFFGLATASPLSRREVPQEHSHNRFLDGVRTSLNLNNPDKIQDPVFGLLGDAAAAAGAGNIKNLECLHQATADQAFTNAKAAGDVTGQSNALIYAALERNTGKVGLASVLCTDAAVNPEIQAIKQHQDPASAGAAAGNKAVVLELAKQLASIGANPQDALLSGTFKPGNLNDNTGKGNTCDTADDVEGCIFTENLLVNDATAAEIDAAVAGVSSSAAPAAAPAASAKKAKGSKKTKAKGAKKGSSAAAPAAGCSASSSSSSSSSDAAAAPPAADAATGTNVQKFTGTLGGAAPPVISSSGDRPFSVNGNTFVNEGAAIQRSCAIQNNACSDAVNSGSLKGDSVADCNKQEDACNAAGGAAKRAACALDFGTCTDPSIEFTDNLPDRPNATAFIASNQQDFDHGSALNIGVISGFICQRLQSSCKAGADAIAACAAGEAAATGKTGQAAADAFNSALGVSA